MGKTKKIRKIEKIFEKIHKDEKLQDFLAPLSLRTTCIAAPLQIEGTLFRKYVYFRSRWQNATLEIAENEKEWRKGNYLFTKSKHFSEKKYGEFHASWLSQTVAFRLIAKWLAEYEKQKFGYKKK